MGRLTYYFGDLYPAQGQYNDTTSTTIPLAADVMAIDQDSYEGTVANNAPDVSGQNIANHYWGLLIIVATILLLGIRF